MSAYKLMSTSFKVKMFHFSITLHVPCVHVYHITVLSMLCIVIYFCCFIIHFIQVSVLFSSGYPNIQVELETPTGLRYVPPTPLNQDDFFSDYSSVESPLRTPSRLSDVLVTQQGNGDISAAPPVVVAEDTSLGDSRLDNSIHGPDASFEMVIHRVKFEDVTLHDEPQNEGSYIEVDKSVQYKEQKTIERAEETDQFERDTSGPEDEITEERLKLLFKHLHLEEVESEEMTEEKVQAILKHVEQAEQEMSSIAGWHTEASSIHVEQSTPERKLNSELLERLDDRYVPIFPL